ncbi:MAG: hypothetical protein OEW78_05785 [Nitrosopumilus sp.]|uniref:hypothetical protein n=1 Tax=Nitrosopumilus sp. TaxID=2024843 RepID=UPI00246CE883|nr:hypothetical protein [Nitrosopumilus sp.]MDH5431376.1 hypothetical protein [Nitrosopumilus sp.]
MTEDNNEKPKIQRSDILPNENNLVTETYEGKPLIHAQANYDGKGIVKAQSNNKQTKSDDTE